MPDFFTGLAPGPEHDRAVAEGQDFIVFYGLSKDTRGALKVDDGPYAFQSNLETAHVILGSVGPVEWTKVRAIDSETAARRMQDAHAQWEAFTNGSPDWQNVVLYSNDDTFDRLISGGSEGGK